MSDFSVGDGPSDSGPLKLNFTDQEAASEARSFDALPSGKYHVKITDIELRKSTSDKNYGKPFWHVEHTVQEGPYADRKLWTNVMLFSGALFSLSQLLKATGYPVGNEVVVPPADEFIGRDVVVLVRKQRDNYAMEKEGLTENDPPIWKNEIRGYQAYGEETGVGAGGGSKKDNLLP